MGWYYYIFYFIDKETGTKRLNDLLVSHNEQREPKQSGSRVHIFNCSVCCLGLKGWIHKRIKERMAPEAPKCLPVSVSRWCTKFSEGSKNRKICDLLFLIGTQKGGVVWEQCDIRDRRRLGFCYERDVVLTFLPLSAVPVLGERRCSREWSPWAEGDHKGGPKRWKMSWARFGRWGKMELDGRQMGNWWEWGELLPLPVYLRTPSSSLGGWVFSCGDRGSFRQGQEKWPLDSQKSSSHTCRQIGNQLGSDSKNNVWVIQTQWG